MSKEASVETDVATERVPDILRNARKEVDKLLDNVDRLVNGSDLSDEQKEIITGYLDGVKVVDGLINNQIELIKDLPEEVDEDQLQKAMDTLRNQMGVLLVVSEEELPKIIEKIKSDEVTQLMAEGYKIEIEVEGEEIKVVATEAEDEPAAAPVVADPASTPSSSEPVVEEKSPEPVTTSLLHEADPTKKPGAMDLLPDNFFESSANRGGKKSISEIRAGFTSAFKEAGLENDKIKEFFDRTFQYFVDRLKLQRDIRRLQRKDEDVEVVNNRISEEYNYLLQSAREFIQISMIDAESGADADVPLEASDSEIAESLDNLKSEFEKIDSVYKSSPEYKNSAEYRAVASALRGLKDYQANIGGSGDKKDQKRRLEKYQTKISKALAALATFVGTLPTPDATALDVPKDAVAAESEVTGRGMAPISSPEHITVIDPSVDDVLDSENTKAPKSKNRFSKDDITDVEPKVATADSEELGSDSETGIDTEPVVASVDTASDTEPEITLEPKVDGKIEDLKPVTADTDPLAAFDTSGLELEPLNPKKEADPLAAFDTKGLELSPIEPTPGREAQYEKSTARSEWRAATKEYRKIEEVYQSSLRDYYSDNSWKAKAGRALFAGKKLIGLNPELPPHLEMLRANYEETRALYAKSLDAALLQRGKTGANKEYTFDAKTKLAFASKFIVKSHEKIRAAQESAVLSPEAMSRLQKTMAFMSKHKWHTRLGVVATAGIIGGLSGGVGLIAAGAGWQASKMVASAAAGALAGKGANWATGFLVRNAEANFENTTKSVKENFSIEDLTNQSAEYAKSFKKVETAKTVQKTATVGAAVAAGGITGYELGQASEVITPFATNIAIPYSGREGGFEHVISNLNLGEDFDPSALPDGKAAEIEQFLRVKISDYLDANVNMSEAKLEANLMSVLERKFGSEPWWADADIEKVDIGDIVLRKIEAAQTAGGAAEAAASTEVPSSNLSPFDGEVKPEYAYEVVKGDTLGDIILDKFKAQTGNFTDAEKSELLARTFAKLEANPELVKQLGLRSGDIDLIYPGEKLNLEVIHDLLDKEGERMTILEDFRKSAPLTVEAETGVKNVPITVVEKPIPGGKAVTFEDATYTEAAPSTPEKPSIPVAPKITPLNGQYLDHPAYKDYLTKVFGSEDQAMREVLKSARDFDASTYDVFDRMKGYESPYTFLSEQKLKDFDVFIKKNPVEIRSFLSDNEIKYETYLAWVGKINELRSTLPASENTRVGDLFAREVALEAAKNPSNFLRK
jgi:hypothetical protein